MVYMAEQQAPVQRNVALKVVKPGMDSSRGSISLTLVGRRRRVRRAS